MDVSDPGGARIRRRPVLLSYWLLPPCPGPSPRDWQAGRTQTFHVEQWSQPGAFLALSSSSALSNVLEFRGNKSIIQPVAVILELLFSQTRNCVDRRAGPGFIIQKWKVVGLKLTKYIMARLHVRNINLNIITRPVFSSHRKTCRAEEVNYFW